MFFCGYTADYDKKLTFDIEKFLDTRAKLHPKDEFFVVSAEDQEVKKMADENRIPDSVPDFGRKSAEDWNLRQYRSKRSGQTSRQSIRRWRHCWIVRMANIPEVERRKES